MVGIAIVLFGLLCIPQDTPEGWVKHTVVLSPDLETVVFGRFHNEEGTSQLVVHTTEDEQRKPQFLEHNGIVRAADFSPDGKLLAAGDYAGITSVRSTDNWEKIAELKLQKSWTTGIAFSPDSRTVATVGSDGTVVLADWEENKELWRNANDGHATCVSFSPDGNKLAVGYSSSRVQILSAQDGTELSSFAADSSFPMTLAYAADGKRIILGCWSSTLQLWDLERKELVAATKKHSERVRSIAVSPSGDYFASAADDKSIILWDTTTGEPKKTWHPEGSLVGDLRFSADGESIVGATFGGDLLTLQIRE